MRVLTLNRERPTATELRIVWEWNPHFRGRRLWRVWAALTPYIIVNAWV